MIRNYGQYIVSDTEAELVAMQPLAGQIGFPMDSKIRLLYDGTSWKPNSAVTVLRATSNVNALTTGATTIYTIPTTSYRFAVLGLHIEYMTLAGTVGVAPAVTVGTNPTSYNNIATSSALVNTLAGMGLMSPSAFTLANGITPLTSGTVIKANVVTAATLYSTYTVRVDVFGYWEV